MAGINIQGGCTLEEQFEDELIWSYTYGVGTDFITVLFSSLVFEVPQIGDTIVAEKLVKKTGYIINNDPGFQAKKNNQETWPIDRKGK